MLVGVKNAQDLVEFEKCWYYKLCSTNIFRIPLKIKAKGFRLRFSDALGSVNLFLKMKAEKYCKQYMPALSQQDFDIEICPFNFNG